MLVVLNISATISIVIPSYVNIDLHDLKLLQEHISLQDFRPSRVSFEAVRVAHA